MNWNTIELQNCQEWSKTKEKILAILKLEKRVANITLPSFVYNLIILPFWKGYSSVLNLQFQSNICWLFIQCWKQRCDVMLKYLCICALIERNWEFYFSVYVWILYFWYITLLFKFCEMYMMYVFWFIYDKRCFIIDNMHSSFTSLYIIKTDTKFMLCSLDAATHTKMFFCHGKRE